MRLQLRFASCSRSGYGLIEVSLALIVLGLVALIAVPGIGRRKAHTRVDRVTALVAADLEKAFAIAIRQRKPVRLACTCASGRYQVTDQSDGMLHLSRDLNAPGEFGVTSLSFSTSRVDILPSGIASSPDTVTISAAGYARRIVMTTEGKVTILP
jgi:prepilin-type N-terminal cleavage/methylation domain-containing protein